MNRLYYLIFLSAFIFISCTKEKYIYPNQSIEVVEKQDQFKEFQSLQKDGVELHLESLNGKLHKGYNEIRIRVKNTPNNPNNVVATISLLPLKKDETGLVSSTPHQKDFKYNSEQGFYSGYVIFNSDGNDWRFEISLVKDYQSKRVWQTIEVQVWPQNNKNLPMIEFEGNDGETYLLALIEPQAPKIGENSITAGIFKRVKSDNNPAHSQLLYDYAPMKMASLQIDPRMPDPSMGNHSSPNNVDLIWQKDDLYHGIVNYTMTGGWTLNFILLYKDSKIVKGTEVPKEFTPGITGSKSELFLDIIF